MKSNWAGTGVLATTRRIDLIINLPNHSLILLLANVWRHFAVNLPRAQSHGERVGHIRLNLHRNLIVGVSGTDPNVSRTLVLELARPEL